MVDFTLKDVARNHKTSFENASKNIIDFLETKQKEYDTTWKTLDEYRVEREESINDIEQIFKRNEIELEVPLSECINEEIKIQVDRNIQKLSLPERENIQIALVKINNRYYEMVKLGAKLEGLSEELSNFRVIEPDSKEEVVISISKHRSKQQETKALEKVSKIKKSSDELKQSLAEELEKLRKKSDEVTNIEPVSESDDLIIEIPKKQASTMEEVIPLSPLEEKIPRLISDEDLLSKEIIEKYKNKFTPQMPILSEEKQIETMPKEKEVSTLNTQPSIEEKEVQVPSEVTNETPEVSEEQQNEELDESIESTRPSYMNSHEEKESNPEEKDSIPYIMNNISLIDIAQNVFDNASYWENIYNFKDNKANIDAAIKENRTTLKHAIKNPTVLSGVKIDIPLVITTYEELELDNSKSRHAA